MGKKINGTMTFNDDESYDAYVSGKATFNKGLRREDGTLLTQPDFDTSGDNDANILSEAESTSVNATTLLIAFGAFGLGLAFTQVPKGFRAIKRGCRWIKKKVLHVFGKDKDEVVETGEIVLSSKEVDKAYKKYQENMTDEEAQKKLLEIFICATKIVKNAKELENANIINREEFIDGIKSEEFLAGINQLLSENPQLLTEYSRKLEEVIGVPLCKEGAYTPISASML